jgi:hypothetical protein
VDIKEEVVKAIAQEEIQKEIANLKAPPKSKIRKIGDFLDSHFGGWLLGSLLLGIFTVCWASYQENCGSVRIQKAHEAAEKLLQRNREDSDFLSKIILETSKDEIDRHCRIAQLMELRHDDCVNDDTSAPCKWLNRFKNEINVEKAREFESCKIYVVPVVDDRRSITSLENRPQGEAAPQTIDIPLSPTKSSVTQQMINDLPARVYIQIFNESDRSRAKVLQSKLKSIGFIVPDIENVGDDAGNKAKSLNRNIIRCYNEGDCKKANEIKEIIGSDFAVQPYTGNANKGTIEVWFKTP